MPHYKYLIIGGGMTADAAARSIRDEDSSGEIAIISRETDKPYDRPPLTKGLWKDKLVDDIWRHTEKTGAEFHLGRKIQKIEPREKKVTDDRQTVFTYEKLLLATGGRPRRLNFGDGQIIYYRTLADYRRLRALTEKHKRFVVIGNGFIGSEIAAALAMNQGEVIMLFPGRRICEKMFTHELSQFITDYYVEKGVEIMSGETATGLEVRHGELFLKTAARREVLTAAVVAGIGIEPNVELARAAGLTVEDGIVVNEFLQTSDPDIYAAGDAASFYNPTLKQQMRVEHEDNANTMGRIVGLNMAGKPEPYHHLPFFYSDLFDFGYEAVGELDSRLETVADWKTPMREGVIYYLKEKRIRGVLLWNIFGQVDAARALLDQSVSYEPDELKGLLPVG